MKNINKSPSQIEAIAIRCHEMNRHWCEMNDDNTQPTWADALGWQKDSVVNGVRFVLENPDTNAGDQHRNWMNEKIKDGWVYGETKDASVKTHPCLVEYHELPADQKFKDYLFRAVVNAAL
jgi:hypothetical protein